MLTFLTEFGFLYSPGLGNQIKRQSDLKKMSLLIRHV